MIVSTRHDFIFIGINKTGTTSIEAALSPYRDVWLTRYMRYKRLLLVRRLRGFKHLPAREVRRLLGAKGWESAFTFTFVRNPWARTLSEFARHRYEGGDLKNAFDAWVLKGGNWLARHNSMRQFVCDESGEPLVDYIGRLENIDEDFARVTTTLGLPRLELSRKNESLRVDYRDVYTDRARRIVTEWVRADAEYFGYSF